MALSLVIVIFLVALVLQVLLAFRSLRKSWMLSIAYLCLSGVGITYFSALMIENTTRIDGLLRSMTVERGNSIRIDDHINLMEVVPEGHNLVYRYQVHGEGLLPGRKTAIGMNCGDGLLRAIMELGGEIRHVYASKDEQLSEIVINRSDCFPG